MQQASRPKRPDAHVADLRSRLARLGDETEVRNLQHAYGYYLDRRMWDDVADLFAADGQLAVMREDGQRVAQSGPESIREALETLYGPAPLQRGDLFDHIMLDTVVTVAPGWIACRGTDARSWA